MTLVSKNDQLLPASSSRCFWGAARVSLNRIVYCVLCIMLVIILSSVRSATVSSRIVEVISSLHHCTMWHLCCGPVLHCHFFCREKSMKTWTLAQTFTHWSTNLKWTMILSLWSLHYPYQNLDTIPVWTISKRFWFLAADSICFLRCSPEQGQFTISTLPQKKSFMKVGSGWVWIKVSPIWNDAQVVETNHKLKYCWWFRNPAITTWDVKNAVNNGMNDHLSSGDRRISEPSTVWPRGVRPLEISVKLPFNGTFPRFCWKTRVAWTQKGHLDWWPPHLPQSCRVFLTNKMFHMSTIWRDYCWWKKSGVDRYEYIVYPFIYREFYIPGGFLAGFLPPSTVCQLWTFHSSLFSTCNMYLEP